MNNLLVNPFIEKLVALILLLLLLLSGYFIFTNLYLEKLFTLDNEINIKNKKIAKVESILLKEKELKEKILLQKNKISKNQIFLSNTKPSNASSELQNKIKRLIAAESKAKILTIKPYPSVKHESYTETSIELRMKNVKHEGIQKILYMIESASPILIIKELDIKRTRLRYKTLVKSKKSDEKLEVILVVSAFFRGEQG